MDEAELRNRKHFTNIETNGNCQITEAMDQISSSSRTMTKELNMGDNKISQMQRQLSQQRIRNKALKMKADVIEQFDGQLHDLLDEILQEVDNTVNGVNQCPTPPRKNRHYVDGVLPDKEFYERHSVLTELLEINHIQTIYHIFVAILIIFSLNTIVFDFFVKGRSGLDFDMITWSFSKFPIVMALWSAMLISTMLIVYPVLYYWTVYRIPGKCQWLDYCCLVMYIAYQMAFLVYPVKILSAHKLPPASSLIIVTEQLRLMMKSHAFVRENIPRALQNRQHDKKNEDELDNTDSCDYDTSLFPDFTKYIYFLFAPTLVYRDNYPRTVSIRWRYVVSNLAQVLACVFYIFYIFERFCVPAFRDFSEAHVAPRRLIIATFGSMLPATLVLFIAFFAILHSWLNAFAEMLRFGDRLFYKDWWNSSSFASYYRTWNVVVHDWLFCYIYKDLFRVFGSQCRRYAMATVFIISAIFHEYVLTVIFGFFYPVLFVMFAGAGFFFTFFSSKNTPRSGNIFMWVALFIGNGMLMCMYSLEWYARISCPAKQNALSDYVMPRSWTCDFSALYKLTQKGPL